jgi:hypothetical protein
VTVPLSEVLVAAARVGDVLDALGVRWYIGGSVASTLHGVPRATMDLDLIADLDPSQAQPLADALSDRMYVDADTIRDAARRRTTFNLIDDDTLVKIDVFCASRAPRHRARFDRVVQERFDGAAPHELPVCSAEDIVIAKLDWFDRTGRTSDRQWTDVLGVLKVRGDRLDRDLLHRLAGEEGLTDLLLRALDDAGRS